MSQVLSTGGGKALIDPADTVLLLLDHQTGLFQTVKDISVAQLRASTTRLGTLLKLPVITTASVPDGPNGPVMQELREAAPQAVYVPRRGEVSAWDNEAFVKTVRDTGRKTLFKAGVWTSVCVMFPALDAKAAGFKVFAVIDASGDPSELASRTAIARFDSLDRWIAEHLNDDLRVGALAEQVHMSPRNFARAYAKKRGRTPAKAVEAIRVEAAKRRLEETEDRIESVAEDSGFSNEEQMRCSFIRILRIPPREYRKRFGTTV